MNECKNNEKTILYSGSSTVTYYRA